MIQQCEILSPTILQLSVADFVKLWFHLVINFLHGCARLLEQAEGWLACPPPKT